METDDNTIETERLLIREFTADDARAYYALVHSLPGECLPELASLTYDEFAEQLNAYIRYQYGFYGYGNFGIYLRSTGALIGIVGLINGSDSRIGELSYAILPEYRRRGYAREACCAALEYGRECGFTSFEARIGHDNSASLSLAESLGIRILCE